jgi:hypothetical protein
LLSLLLLLGRFAGGFRALIQALLHGPALVPFQVVPPKRPQLSLDIVRHRRAGGFVHLLSKVKGLLR